MQATYIGGGGANHRAYALRLLIISILDPKRDPYAPKPCTKIFLPYKLKLSHAEVCLHCRSKVPFCL